MKTARSSYSHLKGEVLRYKALYLRLRRFLPPAAAWFFVKRTARRLVVVNADALLSQLREDEAVRDGLDDGEAGELLRLAEWVVGK